MARTARISSINEALSHAIVAVPVVMRAGVGSLSPVLAASLDGVDLPTTLDEEWCRQQGLKGEPGSVVVLRALEGANIALVSVGSDGDSTNNFRLAGAAIARVAGEGSIAFPLPTDGVVAPGDLAQAFVEGALLAGYSYKPNDVDASIDVVPLGTPLPTIEVHDAVTLGVERGAIIAEAVNWARFLVDSPAGYMSPKALANEIDMHVNHDPHVMVEVWTESKIKEERLGGLLGVGMGSAQPTRVVYVTYDPDPGAELPHVALVGKGITFDSGGLSMKSPDAMMTMKTDMSGAAIVSAVTSIASRLGLRVRINAISMLTENLVGDKATKPGDVLTIRNGMTIEVLNTDAEGRLVLADGLSLATETNADTIIDVATLTGAQNVALGDEVGALFSSDDDLAHALAQASERSGEQLWRMPLVDSYESHIDSDIADMKNIGKPPRAGAIAAALLLRRFTDGRAWAHLDIAGPARADAPRGYLNRGATAFSARTLVEYLLALSTEGA
ncbi:MAG TPA: leucyl aminopeptidase family protein [Acidimicrobiales bacterium]|jgi:leucyl aminopeptidase|nr:leucyl aminopeptidase family protein [Acidimicrobiales bacterium]